jgi:hypothetical protein
MPDDEFGRFRELQTVIDALRKRDLEPAIAYVLISPYLRFQILIKPLDGWKPIESFWTPVIRHSGSCSTALNICASSPVLQ